MSAGDYAKRSKWKFSLLKSKASHNSVLELSETLTHPPQLYTFSSSKANRPLKQSPASINATFLYTKTSLRITESQKLSLTLESSLKKTYSMFTLFAEGSFRLLTLVEQEIQLKKHSMQMHIIKSGFVKMT
jgi:hypothetical protein